jgi:hypothetical protein
MEGECGWVHPDIELKDVLVCVRAFVDILILAAGYQSSGEPASWDPENTTKAIQWAVFFENVLEKIPASEEGKQSKQALDMALSQLTSDPLFPKGLPQLSFSTLAESRKMLLGSLLQAVKLTDNQITAVFTVVSEMDSSNLRDNSKASLFSDESCRSVGNELKIAKQADDSISIYKQFSNFREEEVFVSPSSRALGKETVDAPQNAQGESKQNEIGFESVDHVGGAGAKENSSNQLTNYVIQEIIKRHAASACITSLQKGLKVLSDSVLQKKVGAENHIWEDVSSSVSASRDDTCLCKSELWSHWKNNGLLYLLNGKTLSMVSGARLIFDAAKHQWSQVLESLRGPTDKLDECKMLEIVEICFLGLSSRRWKILIRTLMSATYQDISVSKMWHDLQIFYRGKSLHQHAEEETIDSEGVELEEYLLQLLTNRVQLLWKMPPVLVACSLSIRSTLFPIYMNELQKQIDSDAATARYLCCHQDCHKHLECEIGERIWCLYIFQLDQYNDVSN